MKFHFISTVLIIAAFLLETAGYGRPATDLGAFLFVAGIACEFWFWKSLRRNASGRPKATSP